MAANFTGLGYLATAVVVLAIVAFGSASVFGIGQLVLEGLFVGGLAVVEHKYLLPHAAT